MPPFLFLSGILGLMAVALGAFGAHALKPILLERGMAEAWHTAVLYHLVHAVAILAVSLSLAGSTVNPSAFAAQSGGKLRLACLCWAVGILLFSGSLYLMAGLGMPRLGVITPLGGVAFLAGWISIMSAGWNRSPAR